MVTSRDDYISRIQKREAALIDMLRKQIEMVLQEACDCGQRTFGVQVPGDLTIELLNAVIADYENAGWTVKRSNERNEHRLSFS